jgi:DNA-binding transcriptional ArsR family regulator
MPEHRSPPSTSAGRDSVEWRWGGCAASPRMSPIRVYMLNQMVQCSWTGFDASFAALSDATRRGILEQLGRADASITEPAEKFHMTLTGMKKHVGVLEQAGLVTTEKVGRVGTCTLGLRRLKEEAAWIDGYRQLWDARFDELDNQDSFELSHRAAAAAGPAKDDKAYRSSRITGSRQHRLR